MTHDDVIFWSRSDYQVRLKLNNRLREPGIIEITGLKGTCGHQRRLKRTTIPNRTDSDGFGMIRYDSRNVVMQCDESDYTRLDHVIID